MDILTPASYIWERVKTNIIWFSPTSTKRLEKKLDGNYTRMLRAILNKSWRQHPTRHQLYGHLHPITKTIQVRWARHAGHCWRSRDELISDVLLWTPTHGRAKAGRPARTYIQQLCEDMGCCPEDLPRAMNDREEWRERVRDIRATSAIWWWWWNMCLSYLYKYIHRNSTLKYWRKNYKLTIIGQILRNIEFLCTIPSTSVWNDVLINLLYSIARFKEHKSLCVGKTQ